MMKLNNPKYTFIETINKCEQGITGNQILLDKVIAERSSLSSKEQTYKTAALTGQLFTIPSLNTATRTNLNVVGSLTKEDLEKLYERYFAKEGKPAREIYDAIINSAKEQCPYCGGIGTPKNVDHYLPKAHFPQFSVLPLNLVPSCRNCNMDGKGHAFATIAGDQIIHPYLDKASFFEEQWIFANFHHEPNGEPSYVEYYANPPQTWLQDDKDRVNNHFTSFDIAKRYGKQAAVELSATLKQIENFMNKRFSAQDIIEVLIAPQIESYFCNHWKRVMYQSLETWLVEQNQ